MDRATAKRVETGAKHSGYYVHGPGRVQFGRAINERRAVVDSDTERRVISRGETRRRARRVSPVSLIVRRAPVR